MNNHNSTQYYLIDALVYIKASLSSYLAVCGTSSGTGDQQYFQQAPVGCCHQEGSHAQLFHTASPGNTNLVMKYSID